MAPSPPEIAEALGVKHKSTVDAHLLFDRAATVRTRRRDRRRMRLVLLGRTPPARLPAIA